MQLKAALARKDTIYGLFCSTPAALSVELIAAAGYDFVVIDLEHTLIGPEQLAAMLFAAQVSGIAAFVRVAVPHQAVQALDGGAAGIVFPRVASAEAAAEAARLCRYAPRGVRGLNTTRHGRYGRDDLPAVMAEVDGQTLVVAMIEDLVGLDQADAIAMVDGVDVLLPGAADLSQALGVPWQTRHAQVAAAEARICAAAHRHGKMFCALPRAPDDFGAWHRDGVRLFILGDDRGLARRAFAAHLDLHRSGDGA